MGAELLDVPASEIQPSDSLGEGQTVFVWRVDRSGAVRLHFKEGGEMTLPADRIVRVTRFR